MKNVESPFEEKKELKSKVKRVKRGISTKPAQSTEKTDIPLDFGSKIGKNFVVMTLPIRTVSEANCFEPWQKKHKRHKLQKKLVFFEMISIKHLIKLPCKITFIRYAPKFLDKHDNLPISQKYICDQVCAELTGDHRAGRADDNELITIQYDQIKSKIYGVKVIIDF